MAAKAKRFYKTVGTAARDGGYAVLLDGRVLKTPGKVPLVVPNEKIARLVAAEWDAQAEDIIPATMPCTRLMNVAVERTPVMRDSLVDEIASFARTDLLCYREYDLAAYARHQSEHWDPVLLWAAGRGAKLNTTGGLDVIVQDPAALETIKKEAGSKSDTQLTLFAHFTNIFSSAILGWAVMDGHITADRGFQLSRLAEDWQIRQWGQDEEAAEITEALRQETEALSALIQ